MTKRALVIVDMEIDFCEGGALPVPGGLEVAKRILAYLRQHAHKYDKIVFTLDFHEPWPNTNGGHFSATPDYVDSWPIHCEQNSKGSEFVLDFIGVLINELGYPAENIIIVYKGQGAPHYSGFQGKTEDGKSLEEVLPPLEYPELNVCGLAFDHCVKATCLHAVSLSYDTVRVLNDLSAGITRDSEFSAAAEMAGANVILGMSS